MDLPENLIERDEAVVQTLLAGGCELSWATITSTDGSNSATFTVMADALKLDGVRVSVSARTEQRIADALGCMLLTPKLADLVWAQRGVSLVPFPRPISSSVAATVAHSKDIDKAVEAAGGSGIISPVGKHWVVSNGLETHPGMAENYGWHFSGKEFGGLTGEASASLPNVRVIQGRGWRHDMHHSDYSQTCVLVALDCELNGQPTDIRTILQDPALCNLANHDGVLRVLRQPGADPTGEVVNYERQMVKTEVSDPFSSRASAMLASVLPGMPKGSPLAAVGPFVAGVLLGWIGTTAIMDRQPRRRSSHRGYAFKR